MSNLAGEISKRIRERMGWSQQRLADEIHVSRNYVSLLETGDKRASVRLLTQLEHLLTRVDQEARPPAVHEAPADMHPSAFPEAAQIAGEVDREYRLLVGTASGDTGRLGWLREELRSLAARAPWSLSATRPENEAVRLAKEAGLRRGFTRAAEILREMEKEKPPVSKGGTG